MRLIIFAIYLGIGAMFHALFVGAHFDWTSAWTFGWLFGWPIMIVISSLTFLVGGAIIVGIVVALWTWLDTFANWRERRRTERAKARRVA